jgi:hypothetical protein
MRTQLLGAVLSLLGPAEFMSQNPKPADLAGDWILTSTIYGETNHRRMTVRAAGGQVILAAWGSSSRG